MNALDGVALFASAATSFAYSMHVRGKLRAAIEQLAFWKSRHKKLEASNVKDMSELGRLRAQLAGCSVAATGGRETAKRGDYGWSCSYQDVLDLRRETEMLRTARDHAIHLVEIGGYGEAIEKLKDTRRIGLAGRVLGDSMNMDDYREPSVDAELVEEEELIPGSGVLRRGGP